MTRIPQKAAATLAVGFVLLVGLVTIPQLAAAEEEFFMSKLRAIQDGNVIRIDDNIEGSLGLPVDCIGGIESSANADTMKCYLISNEESWASEYKSDPTVIMQEGTAEACPEGVGFESSKDCFLTTFGSSNFEGQGNYRYVAEFYAGDTLLDTAKDDYRLQTFFVLPESAIGAFALVGS
jgi:hypothetical protein